MKYLIPILFIIGCSGVVEAQKIGAGYSFDFWGATSQTVELNYSYDKLTVHYFHNFTQSKMVSDNQYRVSNRTNTLALSYTPIEYKWVRFGGIFSQNKFPTRSATNVNFYLRIDIPIKGIELSYTHISNGFGLLHDYNPGLDTITFRIAL